MLRILMALVVFVLMQVAGWAAEDVPVKARPGDVYLGDPDIYPSTGRDIFDVRRGYIHPFFGFEELYTDNLFNSDLDKASDFISTFSPGIWLALPGSRQRMAQVDTRNTSPGGLDVSRFRIETERRLQTYALYRSDIILHNNFSEEDRTNQRAEGLINYNFRGGLSVELLDVFEINYDEFSTGVNDPRELDRFSSNFFTVLAFYPVGPKLRLRADYSLFSVNYSADRRSFRDRVDNQFSTYVFYQMLPKLSAFVRYEFTDVAYDEDIQADSNEHNVFTGLDWDVTDKTRGRVQVGYGQKDFNGSGNNSRGDFIFEGRVDHHFTPKTSVNLRASRRTNETDIQGTRDILSDRIQVGYSQRITPRIRANARAFYYRDDYSGAIIIGATVDERRDDYFGGEIDLGYALRSWLNLSAGYGYEERDSNFDVFDYGTNTFYLSFTLAL